ncbi:MAG: hypothetical protein AMXMBFR13_03750 [Phycisphaerae bacterium]
MRGTATAVFVAVLLAIASSATAAEVDYLVSPQSLADGKPEFSPPHGAGTNPFGYDWDSAAPDTVSGGAPAYGTSSFYANVVNSSDGSSPDASSYRTLRLGMRTLFGKNVTVGQLAQLSYYTRKPAPATAIDWRPSIYTTVQAGDGNSSSWYRSRLQARPSSSLNLNAPENAWNQWNTSAGTNQLVFYDNSTARKAAFGSSSLTWDLIAGGEVTGNGGATWDFSSEEIMMIDLTLGANSGGGTGESQIDGVRIELTTGEIADIDLGTVLYVNGSGNNCYGSGAAFTTIQAAIAAASAGDTIMICPGTYVETGQLLIDKDLTIQGAGADSTIVQSTTNTSGGSYDPSAGWWLVTAGNTLTLKGVRLDGTGRAIDSAIQSRGNLAVEDCDFRNIRRSTYVGRAIVLLTGTSTIKNCTFSNIQRIGVHVRGAVLSPLPVATVENCTYTGKGSVDGLDYAVEFGAGGSGTVLNCSISNCTAVASSDQSTSAGVLATDYYGLGTHATVTGSTFFNCSKGIHVGYVTDTHLVDETLLTANNNNFTGSGVETGVRNVATAQVNAENNWWGTANGPGPVGPGSGDRVSDNVDYDPWLTKPAQSNVVYLVPTDDSVYVKPSETVVVDLNVANLTQPVTALQAMLNFSSNFFKAGANEVSVAPGGGVWDDLIYNVWTVGGDLDIAVGVELEQASAGTNVDAKTAYMTLTPAGPEGITQVVFRPDAVPDEYLTQSTILADASGQAVWPAKVNSTNIYIDGTPPVISNMSAGGAVPLARQTVSGTVTDGVSGLESLTYQLNGGAAVPLVADEDGNFSIQVILALGSNSVVFTATDRAGNVGTATVNYSYTQAAPAIDVYRSLAPNKYGSPSWAGWLNNAVAGALAGGTAQGSDYERFEPFTGAQDYSSVMVSGFHSWKGLETANSELGTAIHFVWRLYNGVQSNPGAAKLDPRNISINFHDIWLNADAPGSVDTDYSAWWNATASGAQFGGSSGFNSALKGYNWDGANWVEVTSGTEADVIIYAWFRYGQAVYNDPLVTHQDSLNKIYKQMAGSVAFPADPGPGLDPRQTLDRQELEVTYAAAGVESGSSGAVVQEYETADTTDPVVTVTVPADGLKTNVADLTIEGTATDNETLASGVRSVEIKLNTVQVYLNTTQDDLAFSQPVILTEGSNAIEVIATDFAGNSTTVTRTVVLDTQAPVISIDSAMQSVELLTSKGSTASAIQGAVTIEVSASDTGLSGLVTPPEVKVKDANNVETTLTASGTGPWTYVYTVTASTANGLATITASVGDGSGNVTVDTDTFLVNKNQITGLVELESLNPPVGGITRNVTFVANGGAKTWTIPVSFAQGSPIGTYTLADVPDGTTSLSAKTGWNLRRKLDVTIGEVVSTVGDVSATITKTHGAEGVTFDVVVHTTGPHYGAGLAIGTSADYPNASFQVYFADFSDQQWHYQDYGTGWNGPDTTTLPTGFSASGNASGNTFSITVPYSALGGSGVAYYWSLQVRTNLLGRYPESWIPWSGDTSTFAKSDGSQLLADFTGDAKLLGGDINGSNSINVLDYSILKTNWFSHNVVADITGDGDVNMTDYSVLKTNWFKVGDEQ